MTSMLAGHWLVTALGWAILHSLWQGALIGLLVAAALRALAGSPANRRYVIGCIGLAAMAIAWLATAAIHIEPSTAVREAATRASEAPSRPLSTLATAANRLLLVSDA